MNCKNVHFMELRNSSVQNIYELTQKFFNLGLEYEYRRPGKHFSDVNSSAVGHRKWFTTLGDLGSPRFQRRMRLPHQLCGRPNRFKPADVNSLTSPAGLSAHRSGRNEFMRLTLLDTLTPRFLHTPHTDFLFKTSSPSFPQKDPSHSIPKDDPVWSLF